MTKVVEEVTRHISAPVSTRLWGRAAGRCEFDGCNKPLWKHDVTQDEGNFAEKAHIYAFSANGPRGNEGIASAELNRLGNLMLACHACHQLIDASPGKYSVALLRRWKDDHEARVELVTGLQPGKKSHVLVYGASIGEQSAPAESLGAAMFPHRYPADEKPIRLGVQNSGTADHDDLYWQSEVKSLEANYQRRVAGPLAAGEIAHLSVFALAPQPLLIRLGSLLSDIQATDVYQLHREPKGWAWTDDQTDLQFSVSEPSRADLEPALVFSLSATITPDRVTRALPTGVAIWEVTIAKPHNDFLQSRAQLGAFRQFIRPLMDRIKAKHGQNALLHIFPAMPVAAAVELGRLRMPKADMPWRIYDQNNQRGGFVAALDIR